MSVLFLPPSAGAASVPDASETVSGKIRIATSAEATAGTNDLTAMTPAKTKSVVDAAVVGGVTYQGTFDASSPADLSNASKGDLYIISVAGTYQGQTWAVGDHLLINADMGGTLDPAKIDKVDNTDSVTSVAGRTGAVTLSTADISGLATVASTGAYSDLTGAPTLGTAAAEDVGTSAGNVVQLNGSAQLPAVDGSLLTGITASVAALNDIGDVTITSPSNGEALIYNSTSGDWENGTVSASVAALNDIGDVSAAAPSDTNVIKYNSTSGDWEAGAVAASEVSGLATVASTGAYSDLTGAPTLATVATTGAYSDLSGTPTLGTAAAEDVGTLAGNVVQLDGSARLPAVDGSQLTNLPSGATTLGALTDVDTTGVVDTNVLKYDSGTSTWVDGAVAYSEVTGTPTLATVATTGAYSDLTGTPTLGTAAALDVGTSANNVVQLNGSAQLPAVDGSLLTGITATVAALNDIGDVSAAAPSNTNVIKYNSTSGDWESGAVAYSEVTGTPTLGTAAAEDVGTSAGNVVQLDGSARLPAVDGSQLTNLPTGGSVPAVNSQAPSANYSITSSTGIEEVWLFTPTTAITVQVPSSFTVGAGYRYQIKNLSSHSITVTSLGGSIDGASNFVLPLQYSSITMIADGTNWFII